MIWVNCIWVNESMYEQDCFILHVFKLASVASSIDVCSWMTLRSFITLFIPCTLAGRDSCMTFVCIIDVSICWRRIEWFSLKQESYQHLIITLNIPYTPLSNSTEVNHLISLSYPHICQTSTITLHHFQRTITLHHFQRTVTLNHFTHTHHWFIYHFSHTHLYTILLLFPFFV